MKVFDQNAPYAQAIFIDASEYAEFYRDIRNVDVEVAKRLRKNITAVVKPITAEVRAAALAIPSGGGEVKAYRKSAGGGKAGLRQGIAAATEHKVVINQRAGFGIRIRVSGSKFAALTGKTRTLPRYMEALGKKFQRWRHPVFVPYAEMPGPDGSWVSQDAHPFLLPTANKHRDKVTQAVKDAFDEAHRAVGFK